MVLMQVRKNDRIHLARSDPALGESALELSDLGHELVAVAAKRRPVSITTLADSLSTQMTLQPIGMVVRPSPS
jgi:hypothetical protein